MENPELFAVLKQSLVEKKIGNDVIEKYRELWESLRPNIPMPCPLCFALRQKQSRLYALPEENGEEPVKCEVCKEVFYVPISD